MTLNRDTTLAVIGLGYVGLPLAVEFGKTFMRFPCYDFVAAINSGEITEPNKTPLSELQKFTAKTEIEIGNREIRTETGQGGTQGARKPQKSSGKSRIDLERRRPAEPSLGDWSPMSITVFSFFFFA